MLKNTRVLAPRKQCARWTQHPPNDQMDEEARFVVSRQLKAGTISHDTLLRMRDAGWSWHATLTWVRPNGPGGYRRLSAR